MATGGQRGLLPGRDGKNPGASQMLCQNPWREWAESDLWAGADVGSGRTLKSTPRRSGPNSTSTKDGGLEQPIGVCWLLKALSPSALIDRVVTEVSFMLSPNLPSSSSYSLALLLPSAAAQTNSVSRELACVSPPAFLFSKLNILVVSTVPQRMWLLRLFTFH